MIDRENESPAEDQDAEKPAKDSRSTPPRGNPDQDRQSVEKGEEQLDRITGH